MDAIAGDGEEILATSGTRVHDVLLLRVGERCPTLGRLDGRVERERVHLVQDRDADRDRAETQVGVDGELDEERGTVREVHV